MKKLLFLFISVMVATTFTACKQDQYYLFDDVSRLQFGPNPTRIYTTSYNLADTLKPYTFFYEDASVKEDTVYFDLYTIGGTKDVDRPFVLEQEQIPNAINAVAGTDYVSFSDPKVSKFYTIKAGTVHTSVPIIVLRSPNMKTTTPKLKFKVVANENFQLGEKSNLWRKVEITDRLSQPAAWTTTFNNYLGKYSVVKNQFLIDTTGDKWDNDFITNIMLDMALVGYYQAICKTALINYNNAHPGNPLKDENGELVVIP